MLTVLTRIVHFLFAFFIIAKHDILLIELTFFITILVFPVILGRMTSKQKHLLSSGPADEQDVNLGIKN